MRQEERSGSKLRYIGHSVLLAVCWLLQVTPGLLPRIFGTLPMPVMVCAVCIAMFEKDLAGAVFGLVGGLLTDLNSLHAPGFNAILMMMIGCAVGLLVSNLMKNTLSAALMLNAGALLAYHIVYWFCFYLLGRVEHALYYFARYELVSIVYTLLFVIPVYLLVRRSMKSAKT